MNSNSCGGGRIRTGIPKARTRAAAIQEEYTRLSGKRGWITGYLKHALISDRFAIPLGGVQRLTVSSGNLLRLKYENLSAMLSAAEIVLQGTSDKQVVAPVVAAGGVATTVAFTSQRSIGALIRISDNWNSADGRQVPIAISGTGAASVTFALTPCHHWVDLLVLFVSNNIGEGTLVAPDNGTVTIAADRLRAGALVSIESVTLRDLL